MPHFALRLPGRGKYASRHTNTTTKWRMQMFRHAKAALAVAFAALALPALAQDLTGTLKKIKDSGNITIGHRETSIPRAARGPA